MFGVLRRKVVSGCSSASISGKSWRKMHPVASTPIAFLTPGEEILLHPRTIGNVRSVGHLTPPGHAVNIRPLRNVMTSLQPCVSMQMRIRLFSSDSGVMFI